MQSFSPSQTETQVKINTFVRSVYNWMSLGLFLTASIAWIVANNQSFFTFVYQAKWIFFIAEIGLVFYISRNINKLEASTASSLFMLYAALNGATMSIFFLIYTVQSIASTFLICAATFGVCSLFGWVTKRDLTGLGNFMFMGFIGIFIASIVNIFLKNQGLQAIISYIGVLVFTGLTAYDTQKIKYMALAQSSGLDGGVVRKGAVIGALTLYLDFILMFQYLLMIFGGRRN